METILRTYYTSKNISKNNLSIQLFKKSRLELRKNAEKIISLLSKKVTDNNEINIVNSQVEAGSGSLPTEKIDSVAISISSKQKKVNELFKSFLNDSNPIIGYVNSNKYYIDLKAITEDQIDIIITTMNKVLV